MSKISLKTDYKDGQILYGDELNVNNTVMMTGVNDNFDRITNLGKTKADIVYVDNVASTKVDLTTLNRKIQEIDYLKADKSELSKKASQEDVDLKANKSDVALSLQGKADTEYVDMNLNTKVSKTQFNESLETKADKILIGDLDDLNTSEKGSLVEAINSVNRETLPIASLDNVGMVKPDGTTVTIDQDGTIHAVNGGGTGSGTTDYNALSNKPIINGVEVKGKLSLDDLKLMSKSDINNSLDKKANKNDVYTKDEIDTDIKVPLSAKANKADVNNALANKANISDVYKKSVVDELISASEAAMNSKLLNKVDLDSVYSKPEVDGLVEDKADGLNFDDNMLQLKSGDKLIGTPVEVKVATSDILIQEENPSEEDEFKLWINNGEVDNLGSEVVNSLSGNETTKAPSVQTVNRAIGVVGWTNPAPSDLFSGQAISLNTADYDEYEIEYKLTSSDLDTKSTGRISNINRAYMDYTTYNSILISFSRKITSKSSGTITFGDAYNLSTNEVDNTKCIPQRVILYTR